MNKFLKHLLCLGLLGLSGSVYAQAPHVCGAGPGPNEVMAGMHSGGHGVAPTPLCYWKSESLEGAAPAVQWADRWGAIAADDSTSAVFGIVANMSDKQSAQKAALSECRRRGGGKCELSMSYYNQCAAVAAGKEGTFPSSAATETEAKQRVIQRCEQANSSGKCWIYYSGCSLPVRLN